MKTKNILIPVAIIGIILSCKHNDQQSQDFEDNATFISDKYIIPLLNDEINTLFFSIKNCSAEHGRYEKELLTAKKIIQNYEPFRESSVSELSRFTKLDQEINDVVRSYLEETNRFGRDSTLYDSKIVEIKTTEAHYSQLASELLAIKVRNALFLLSTYTCTSELDMDKKNYPIESLSK